MLIPVFNHYRQLSNRNVNYALQTAQKRPHDRQTPMMPTTYFANRLPRLAFFLDVRPLNWSNCSFRSCSDSGTTTSRCPSNVNFRNESAWMPNKPINVLSMISAEEFPCVVSFLIINQPQ